MQIAEDKSLGFEHFRGGLGLEGELFLLIYVYRYFQLCGPGPFSISHPS